ncbi:hypothetical protein [Thermococcus sp.]|uniref:hypothetical protein n=1 Tax=Thermococcus sp. TaxID=35749 RepID=UPI00261F3888|nr:hypothetical protein [Thermococcus sp.]
MTSFKEALSNVYIRLGLVLLLLSLVLAVVSLRTSPYSFQSSGYLEQGRGVQLLGNQSASHTVSTRTLVLSGNGTLVVIAAGTNKTYSLNGTSITLHPSDTPILSVVQGRISYCYEEEGIEYHYLNLAVVAFVIMLLGSMFSIYGFTHVMSDLKREREKRRRGS